MDEEQVRILALVLAELVDDMGGIVELDAIKLRKQLKQNPARGLKIDIVGNKLIVEVIDEDPIAE